RALRRWRQSRRTQRENLLKSVYLALQTAPGSSGVSLDQLANFRRESLAQTRQALHTLVQLGWSTVTRNGLALTDQGLQRARELDRNYRLWEQFLTEEVNLPIDHTRRDAENIEHIL